MSAVRDSGTASVRQVARRAGRRRPRRRSRPSATSIRTVSTAYSGMPSARATIASTAAAGQARHEPGQQLAHRAPRGAARGTSEVKLRLPAPQSGRRSSSSGRARVTTRSGTPRLHSSRWSMKSSRPESAQCRSSNTRSTGAVRRRVRSKKVRHAANSSAEPALPADAQQGQERRLDPAPLLRRRARARRPSSAILLRRGRPRRRSRRRPARLRTISPSAQKRDALAVRRASGRDATRPSRPGRRGTSRNSQASRLLPIPPGPMSETRRGRCSRPVAWNRSLSRRSSSSRPTNGASSASAAVPAATLRHDAERPPGGHRRRLALERLLAGRLEDDRTRRGALGRLADEDRAGLGAPTAAAPRC